METLNGLPAHPLFVHLPVVLIPLSLIGVIIMVARPSWYLRYRWAVLGTVIVGGVSAWLAEQAGESLVELLSAAEGAGFEEEIHDHEEAGEFATMFSILFMLATVAFIFVPRYLNRHDVENPEEGGSLTAGPSWVRPTLGALSIVLGLVASFGLFQAGETGADAVWAEEMEEISGAEGSEADDDHDDDDDDDEHGEDDD